MVTNILQVTLLTGFSDPVYTEAYVNVNQFDMNRIVRKPDFCLCENKGADRFSRVAAHIVLDVFVVNQTVYSTKHLIAI